MPTDLMAVDESNAAHTTEKKPQTCDTCKIRHQKCDSVRPTCHHCKIRDLKCCYSSFSAKSTKNTATARQGTKRSKRPGGALDGPQAQEPRRPWSDATTPDTLRHAANVREILRGEFDHINLPAAEKENLIQSISRKLFLSGTVTPIHCEPPTDLVPTPVAAASTQALISILAQVVANRGGQHAPSYLASLSYDRLSPSPSTILPLSNGYRPTLTSSTELPRHSEAQAWMETFFNGPNRLFTIVTMRECRTLFDKYYKISTPLKDRELCLLTYVLAAGARYSENVSSDVYLRWICRARNSFEECASKVPGCQLWALQPMLLSCLISMHTEPEASWFTLGMAIYVAQIYRIDQKYTSNGPLTKEEYEIYRSRWETIIFFDSRLSIMLGRQPMVQARMTLDPLVTNVSAKVRATEASVTANLAQLSLIVGRVMQEVHSTHIKPTLSVFESYIHLFDTWAATLPLSLRFQQRRLGIENPGHPRRMDDVASLHLELVYLDARMLLLQPLLAQRAASMWGGAPQLASSLWFLAQTSADSALEVGRISLHMAKQGIICKRLWLVTTINYRSALILLLMLFIRQAEAQYGASDPQQQQLHTSLAQQGLDVSLQVLAFCAQHDTYAQHFLDVIRTLREDSRPSASDSVAGDFSGLQLLPELASFLPEPPSPTVNGTEQSHMAMVDTSPATASQPFLHASPFTDPSLSTDSDSCPTSATVDGSQHSFGGLMTPTSMQPSISSPNAPVSFHNVNAGFYPWQDPALSSQYPESYSRGTYGSAQMN